MVNKDAAQLKAEEDFLQSGFITVDLFAATEVTGHEGRAEMLRRTCDVPAIWVDRFSKPLPAERTSCRGPT